MNLCKPHADAPELRYFGNKRRYWRIITEFIARIEIIPMRKRVKTFSR